MYARILLNDVFLHTCLINPQLSIYIVTRLVDLCKVMDFIKKGIKILCRFSEVSMMFRICMLCQYVKKVPAKVSSTII